MKTLVTTVLIAILLLASPPQPRAQTVTGKNVLIGCGLLIVGGIIIYGLWKLCKKIPCPRPPPSDDPPSPPQTNAPPATNPSQSGSTGGQAQFFSASQASPTVALGELDCSGVQPYDVSQYAWPDPVTAGAIIVNKSLVTLQCSTNLVNWQDVWKINIFSSSNGAELWEVYQNGSNIFNAYYTNPRSGVNYLPVDFEAGMCPRKHFRLATPAW
jgi:hypothetical protein